MDAGGTSPRTGEGRIMQEQLSRATQEQLPNEGLFGQPTSPFGPPTLSLWCSRVFHTRIEPT